MPRAAECHPDRVHYAKGRCKSCYSRDYHAEYRAHPVRAERSRQRSRAWHADHRVAANERRTQWTRDNPERYRETQRLATQVRNAYKRANPMDTDDVVYMALLRADPCSYCGGPAGEADHITPVRAGGSSHWDNLTSACRSCNARKHAKPLLVAMLEMAA